MFKQGATRAAYAAQFFAKCRSTIPRANRQPQLNPSKISIRKAHVPAEDPEFTSIVDAPARLVKVGKPHTKKGVLVLGMESFYIVAHCLKSPKCWC